ncbi:alpha-amylase family glycosyl hydrolase [Promethearchaeum syntrophicum]|uniref:Alpha-amylase family glycosyl hydrolase n=1 Tax=Promethearchaeum syntrophicum TaxID=2594042 RepID=A0A5B9DD87_9ARCH|nr:alpha-amylase family glycosyl hydrolase [Candidatus Prometheoarchaeum syntrophicum]QEE17082.1 maltodextrin glucosidase [Candidatus Prometheoarchaeum syntrophicum]
MIIFEINTWPWLNQLSHKKDHPITLENIPKIIFDKYFDLYDTIWLMGVWKRSQKSKFIASTHRGLLSDYKHALSDFSIDDVIGSPYAIYEYNVDPNLGGNIGLKIFYKELKSRNKNLILDFVPNHLSRDNPWRESHPEYFIQGSEVDSQINPTMFFKTKNKIFAHGKDPYFPAWTDTLQVNPFSIEFRIQVIETLSKIAKNCDGVRCDMAMLLTNSVFQKTWGLYAGKPLKKEFWVEVISEIKKKYPDFLFIAEVYWDMEWELIHQGFDFCYDKRLYDRLLHRPIGEIKGHLQAELKYQNHLVRFIENHDEERAITSFGLDKSLAAAMITLTLPGCSLVHYGQDLGLSIKLPVQLGRYPPEPPNKEIQKIYADFIKVLTRNIFSNANWNFVETNNPLIFYYWKDQSTYFLVICNYSVYTLEEIINLNDILGETMTAEKNLVETIFSRKYNNRKEENFILKEQKINLKLNPWEFLILKIINK